MLALTRCRPAALIIRTIGKSSLKHIICRVDLDYEVPHTSGDMRPVTFLAPNMVSLQPRRNSLAGRSYAKIFRRRRFNAFVVSGLAIFVFCCTVNSLGVRGMVTTSEFTFGFDRGGGELDAIRRKVIANLDEASVESCIVKISAPALVDVCQVCEREIDDLRRKIHYAIAKNPLAAEYQIRISMAGDGGKEDGWLLENLAVRVAKALSVGPSSSDRICAIEDQVISFKSESRVNELAIRRGWNEIEDVIHQFEEGLTVGRHQLKTDQFAQSLGGGQQGRTSAGAIFNQASYGESEAKVPLAPPSSGVLSQLDTAELKRRFNSTRKMIQASSEQQSNAAIDLVALAKNTGASQGDATFHIRTSRQPVGGVPGRDLLMVFLAVSLFLGWVVSGFYRPELADKGYTSHKQISDSLGLPVVARVDQRVAPPAVNLGFTYGISNTFVACAEIALMGVFLLTIVICLLEPVVGTSLVENPLHGLARVTWMFLGN